MSTHIERQVPGDALLVLCEKPVHVKTTTVGTIIANGAEAQIAFDHCAARMCRLVQWLKPTVQCDADTPPATP